MMKKLKIVFMGTPEFAVGILDTLVQNQYDIVGVITAPDKPAGRGQKIKYSAVKEYALAHQLKILQPTNLKDNTFLEELRSLEANLQIVVAFRMLPEVVWNMPKWGTFNLHASLLPNYRGAAPINWAIINGETTTGVTTFFIDEKIDTGATILCKEIEILPDDNAGTLHDKLMHLGGETVLETLNLIAHQKAVPTPQTDTPHIKTAYKLNRDNCKIDFTKKGVEICNLIRGLNPFPGAWCFFKDETTEWNVKIYEAQFIEESHNHPIGTLITTKKELKVALSDGFLMFLLLQFPGKKKMSASELLNGMSFDVKTVVY